VVHLEDATSSDMAIPIDDMMGTTTDEDTRDRPSDNISSQVDRPPRPQDLVFYHHHHHHRRNSRSMRSLASGSSTEVETDPQTSHTRDLMDID
jgi:poly-gamma-glutamate capsule biosynthesis protein CapA/YwtB (metallophosphatase superfamily)